MVKHNRIINSLLLTFLLASVIYAHSGCNDVDITFDKNLTGNYLDKKLSLIERGNMFLKHNNFRRIGNTLILSPDSSFLLRSCGDVTIGHWKTEGDSLLLFCKSIKWINDSLNLTRPLNCGTEPNKFFITIEGDLKQIIPIQSNKNPDGEASNATTWLTKD